MFFVLIKTISFYLIFENMKYIWVKGLLDIKKKFSLNQI